MESTNQHTPLLSGQSSVSKLPEAANRRLSQSLDMDKMFANSNRRENGEYGRISRGIITEKRESTEDGSERKKVTYVFQLSGTSSSMDSLQPSDGVSGDPSIKAAHCHTDAIKNSMDKKARKKLILASILCLIFMIGEMVGGFLAQSLAIISDAAHLLTDLASFMISLMALYLANRPATSKFSFGWHRAEILGAFTSILMLWVLTGILAFEAVERVKTRDFEIDATIMLITAAAGVAFNILLGTTLHQHSHSHGGGSHGHSHNKKAIRKTSKDNGSSQKYGSLRDEEANHTPGNNPHIVPLPSEEKGEGHGHSHGHGHGRNNNINVRAAFVHVLGDLLQSIGVLIASFIIYFKPEWKLADPICTFLFSLFVLITTLTIMKDIVMVLMEAAPRGLSFIDVRKTLLSVSSVVGVHNLRLWSLTMDKVAVSAHLAIARDCNPHDVLRNASATIRHHFNISEMTFQIEEYITEMDDCHDCQCPKT